MAKLGDAFSESDRRKSALRRLIPGAVVYLEVVLPGDRKHKFLVVASVDAECCTFVINSRVHPFIEARPDLSVCQVKADAVVAELVADMGKLKGRNHRDVLDEIAAAVKRAPTLSIAEQTRLVESLRREDD